MYDCGCVLLQTSREVVRSMKLFVYSTAIEGRKRNFVSLLKPSHSFREGISEKAIIGEVTGDREINAANFIPNRAFLELFHTVIGSGMTVEPECIREAEQLGEGWVYLIDRRTDRKGGIAPEDIIGGMKAEKGLLVRESYRANPNYLLISERGFFQLPPKLSEALIQAAAGKD